MEGLRICLTNVNSRKSHGVRFGDHVGHSIWCLSSSVTRTIHSLATHCLSRDEPQCGNELFQNINNSNIQNKGNENFALLAEGL